MQLAIGDVLEGKVTGITKFGAFVELPEGKTGMVHISEVSADYVEDISQYLKQDQIVKVKVINITEEGKISLSIKKRCRQNPVRNRANAVQASPSVALVRKTAPEISTTSVMRTNVRLILSRSAATSGILEEMKMPLLKICSINSNRPATIKCPI